MSTKVKIYPANNIAGILNRNGSYSKQTTSQGQGIVIGKDNSNAGYSPIGRGYLNFDLSKIPQDATIENVSLQLTSKIYFDKNFGGTIRIERVGIINEANSTTWGIIKTLNTNHGIAGLNQVFEKEGYGYGISHQWLTEQVKGTLGKSLQLMLNNRSENTSVVRLDGSDLGTYLSVTYTPNSSGGTGGGGTGGTGGTGDDKNYEMIITKITSDSSNNRIKFEYSAKTAEYTRIWKYDKKVLKLIEDYHRALGGWGIFEVISQEKKATILGIGTMKWSKAERNIHTPAKITPNKASIFIGETITYTCNNLPTGATDVKWNVLQGELLSTSSNSAKVKIRGTQILMGLSYSAPAISEVSSWTKGEIFIEDYPKIEELGPVNYPNILQNEEIFTCEILGYKVYKSKYSDLEISFTISPRQGTRANLRLENIDNINGLIKLSCFGAGEIIADVKVSSKLSAMDVFTEQLSFSISRPKTRS